MKPKRKTSKRAGKRRSHSFFCIAPHPLIAIALAVFGCLLWLHFHLFVKFNNQQYVPVLHIDDAPITRVGTAGSRHLKKLANDLTTLFSAQGGIASADQQGFEIAFPLQGSKSTCSCDIISEDCLDMITCLTDLHSPPKRNALAWIGIELRRAMKANSKYEPFKFVHEFKVDELPLGKMLQYNTIGSWRAWRTRNVIYEYNRKVKSIFIDPLHYPYCRGIDNGTLHPVIHYDGPSCFYQSPKDPEESAGTIIEVEANRWYHSTVKNSKDTKKQIRRILDEFMRKHRPLPKEPEDKLSSDSSDLAAAEFDVDFSALGSLFLFAHMARIKFNRRPFLDKIYREQLTAVVVPKFHNAMDEGNTHTDTNSEDPFILSLHMRRGDSCGDPDPETYENRASSLDSKAQAGGDRKCYQTEVYLRAVARVRQLVPRTRPLHVHLATDDVGNVMHEIFTSKYEVNKRSNKETNNKVSANALGVDKWYFLNITRDHFLQKSDTIEADENFENWPKLGETAVTDIWLLSHGHAFVGHLGSRFGKVSWLLATARRNSFIPFFSVDGHSKYTK